MNTKDLIKKLRRTGLIVEADRLEAGLCPFCERPVKAGDFKDELSLREFEISGLCQRCQDEVFEPEHRVDRSDVREAAGRLMDDLPFAPPPDGGPMPPEEDIEIGAAVAQLLGEDAANRRADFYADEDPGYVPAVGQRFKVERKLMVSGRTEAVAKVYEMVVGKSGCAWFIPQNENPADGILVTDSADWQAAGRGFGGSGGMRMVENPGIDAFGRSHKGLVRGAEMGGATLQLMLVDGSVFPLMGGWHSNSHSLFVDTGIDLRSKHLTRVVIGLGRTFEGLQTWIDDVVYCETMPLLGTFDRGDALGREYANRLGRRVIVYRESLGGSVLGGVDPDPKSDEGKVSNG